MCSAPRERTYEAGARLSPRLLVSALVVGSPRVKTLERRLGLPAVVAISIGAMLGSGLFVLPGMASALTGPSVWIAYIVAGAMVLPAALSKAELATAMPTSGGTYVYIDRAFGPLVGTIAGLALWLSLLLKSAFALVGFGSYLSAEIGDTLPLLPTSLVLLGLVVALNVAGVHKIGKIQLGVVGIALSGLIVLSLWGARSFDHAKLEPAFTGGTMGFAQAVAFVYIAFAGVTKVGAIAEEVKDPGRTLPRGILLSLGLVTIVYGAVVLCLVGNVPEPELAGDLRPIYTLALSVSGPVVASLVALLAVLTMTSMATSGVLAASRFPFAMARDDLLPPQFRHISERFGTPTFAIVATGLTMAAVLATMDIASIAKLASSAMIAAFIAVNAAVIVLRESDARWYRPSYRAPFYPWVQGFGVIGGVGLLVATGWLAGLALVVMVGAGLLLYFAYGRKRTDRRGVLGRLGPRRELLQDFEDVLPSDAAAVVALTGRERSAETLVEVGAALAEGGRVEVLHLSDVPEQIGMGTVLDDDGGVRALERRLLSFGRKHQWNVEFDAVATRDVVETIHRATVTVGCRWLVMPWRESSVLGITSVNPLGWLINNLTSNLALLRDAGVREICEILVIPQPGPHDVLVASTAERLGAVHEARIVFARFVHDDATGLQIQSEVDYLEQVSVLCDRDHRTIVLRGKNEVAAIVAASVQYDLLVLGASGDRHMKHILWPPVEERVMREASCSALVLRRPRKLVHDALRTSSAERRNEGHTLVEMISPELLEARLEVKDKAELFRALAEHLARASDSEPKVIEKALREREETQNTAVGNGVALPHATLQGATQTYLGIFTVAEPLDYNAPDGGRVDVLFATLGPPSDRNHHLRVLAAIAHRIHETDLLARVRCAESREALQAAVEACDGDSGPRPSSD